MICSQCSQRQRQQEVQRWNQKSCRPVQSYTCPEAAQWHQRSRGHLPRPSVWQSHQSAHAKGKEPGTIASPVMTFLALAHRVGEKVDLTKAQPWWAQEILSKRWTSNFYTVVHETTENWAIKCSLNELQNNFPFRHIHTTVPYLHFLSSVALYSFELQICILWLTTWDYVKPTTKAQEREIEVRCQFMSKLWVLMSYLAYTGRKTFL